MVLVNLISDELRKRARQDNAKRESSRAWQKNAREPTLEQYDTEADIAHLRDRYEFTEGGRL